MAYIRTQPSTGWGFWNNRPEAHIIHFCSSAVVSGFIIAVSVKEVYLLVFEGCLYSSFLFCRCGCMVWCFSFFYPDWSISWPAYCTLLVSNEAAMRLQAHKFSIKREVQLTYEQYVFLVGLSKQYDVMDVVRSAPQGDPYHSEVSYFTPELGKKGSK